MPRPPSASVPLLQISLVVSVDVEHHVDLLTLRSSPVEPRDGDKAAGAVRLRRLRWLVVGPDGMGPRVRRRQF